MIAFFQAHGFWLAARAEEEEMLMNVRRFTVASLPLLALPLLAGSALTANAGALDYCKADAARLCPGIEGPPVLKCLKEHAMEVSIGCGKAVKKMKAEMGK